MKNSRGTAYVQLIRIQGTIHKSDFGIYHLVTIFNLPQNVEDPRILNPSQILIPPFDF